MGDLFSGYPLNVASMVRLPGVDYHGVLRAAYSNLVTGGKTQGASTITMQVARNFFLSREKTLTRKLYEALLAFKIENSLSKDQILEIYINQIYLGQKAYGFGAAAQVYFGKTLSQLNSAEIAMLAGLPKAPSSFNPVINPKRAKQRQLYVLRRMHELAALDGEQYEEAQKLPISVKREAVTEYEIHAEFVAEMVRQLLYERYPEEVYSRGFRVYTTISRVDQEAAYAALRQGLLEYDRRHGYRGPEGFVDLKDAQEEDYEEILQDHPDSDDLLAALVLEATPKRVTAYRRGGETVTVSGEGLKFAERMLDSRTPPTRRIRRGAVIRIQKDDHDDRQIVQLPETEGAFFSVNPQDNLPIVMVVLLDANHSATPDPAGRWGAGIEHAFGELESLSGHGNGFSSAPVGCHPFRRRLQNECREEVITVGMVLQNFLIVLLLRVLEIDESFGAAIAVAPVVFEQTLAQRRIGRFLVDARDRGVDAKPARVDLLRIAFVEQLTDHLGDELSVNLVFGDSFALDADRKLLGLLVLLAVERGKLVHAPQHVQLALLGAFGIDHRVERRGSLGQPGKHRDLGGIELG